VSVTAVVVPGLGGFCLRLLVRALHLAILALHLLAALLAVVLALAVPAVIHALVLGAMTGVRVCGWGGLARDGRGNDKREGAKNHFHLEISETEV
jgi:hypothetical protein